MTNNASTAVVCADLADALNACADGTLAGLKTLAMQALPGLVAVTQQYVEAHEEVEDIVHDTLYLAWQNAWRFDAAEELPGHWLMHILGNRLNSQLSAPYREAFDPEASGYNHLEPVELPPPMERHETLATHRLWNLAECLTPGKVSDRLRTRLTEAFEVLSVQSQMPLTPSGENADPRLFDPILAPRMRLSRLSLRTKQHVDQYVVQPLANSMLTIWMHQLPGAQHIERWGLPRHSVEARFQQALDIEVTPRDLVRNMNYPRSFPDRRVRHGINKRLLWDGDWDQRLEYFRASRRMHFITDIWEHRRNLCNSRSYHQLAERLAHGNPIASHSDGIMLDRPERIHAYLRRYVLYMESMACFGFDNQLGKDPLAAAVDRNGGLVKINKGLHRLAMAQVLGIPRITIRVRGIHHLWWQQVTAGTTGIAAMERMLAALPNCPPSR
ncbi:hypothetical protein [Halomonas huangheensis]|uniref:hypothetical protein n=1 Tax=Halomonas huangheensis TaxID=1178482 RepID=UPI00138ADA2B|nr:hypothetical protein [Halomonas huangheensis]